MLNIRHVTGIPPTIWAAPSNVSSDVHTELVWRSNGFLYVMLDRYTSISVDYMNIRIGLYHYKIFQLVMYNFGASDLPQTHKLWNSPEDGTVDGLL